MFLPIHQHGQKRFITAQNNREFGEGLSHTYFKKPIIRAWVRILPTIPASVRPSSLKRPPLALSYAPCTPPNGKRGRLRTYPSAAPAPGDLDRFKRGRLNQQRGYCTSQAIGVNSSAFSSALNYPNIHPPAKPPA